MNYKITSEASKDLEKIWLYTFENWSIEQADRYLNLIFDEIEFLCQKPDSAINYDHIRKGYSCSKVKSHIIFFKINIPEKELEIIRVLHEMMDLDILLR